MGLRGYKSSHVFLDELKPDLKHYGTKYNSGRYPYGSGENPFQHDPGFTWAYAKLRKEHPDWSQTEYARAFNMSSTEFRKKVALENEARDNARRADILRLMNEQGLSQTAAFRELGIPESTGRGLLKSYEKKQTISIGNVAEQLKNRIGPDSYIDVSKGSEAWLGITRNRLDNAIAKLKAEGYVEHKIFFTQMTTRETTAMRVLCPPGTEFADAQHNQDRVKMVTDVYFEDNGLTSRGIKEPQSIKSDRVAIRYGDQGGKDMDGVILLRPGVEDLSLGKSRYAQVRIAVDGTHYLKGMAMYSNDIPKGYDILFNTNKDSSVAKMDVLKKLSSDPDNPFGSSIKESALNKEGLLAGGQSEYIGSDGKKHLSAINKINEEGDWDKWSRNLASQFLSKQSMDLAKKQLSLDYANRNEELESIKNVVNPVARKQLLDEFADACDAAAVDLKAAALPRQQSQVILPLPSIKENEIYAPNFKNGETVILVRYPHAGRFEIPELKVNNNTPAAKVFKNDNRGAPHDAVGIHPKVAEQLSGADFDGDTVVVIPNPKINSKDRLIKVEPILKQLEGFDPKESYKKSPTQIRTEDEKGWDKQREMGKVSNLITDMTLKGAKQDEIARAVKHSMVVIDAEKHNLDWRLSEKQNGIRELRKLYQGKTQGGASTLISRAGGEVAIEGVKKEGILKTDPITGKQTRVRVDPETGKKLFTYEKKEYVDKDGKIKKMTTKETRMGVEDDPYKLSSGLPMENLYASYASNMKSMANAARKESLSIKTPTVDPEAKSAYAKEVASLNSKLAIAIKNKPLERQAQIMANLNYASKVRSDPTLADDYEKKKKLRAQCLAGARATTGGRGKKDRIYITDREWEAISKNALPASTVKSILDNSDSDRVKELATPRTKHEMTPAKIARAKAMAASTHSTAEIAEALGVSPSTIRKYLAE